MGAADEGAAVPCAGCGKLTYMHKSNPPKASRPGSLFCRRCYSELSEEEQKQEAVGWIEEYWTGPTPEWLEEMEVRS